MSEFDKDALAEFELDADGPVQVPSLSENSNAARRNESMQALIHAWRTEANSPEILEYQEDLVHNFLDLLKRQEAEYEKVLDELDDDDSDIGDKASRTAILDIYAMETERVKYSLARYLRTRILKIENSVHYLISSIEHQDRLSSEEREFLYRISKMNNNYLDDQISRHVTSAKPDYKKYLKPMKDDLVLNAEPDHGTYVFAMSENDTDVRVGDNRVPMSAAEVNVVDFKSVRQAVLRGEVYLM